MAAEGSGPPPGRLWGRLQPITAGEDGKKASPLPLFSAEHTVGRNELGVDTKYVSRVHFSVGITQATGGAWLKGSSTNGTFLNGTKLVPGQTNALAHGDIITLVKATEADALAGCRFHAVLPEAAAAAPEAPPALPPTHPAMGYASTGLATGAPQPTHPAMPALPRGALGATTERIDPSEDGGPPASTPARLATSASAAEASTSSPRGSLGTSPRGSLGGSRKSQPPPRPPPDAKPSCDGEPKTPTTPVYAPGAPAPPSGSAASGSGPTVPPPAATSAAAASSAALPDDPATLSVGGLARVESSRLADSGKQDDLDDDKDDAKPLTGRKPRTCRRPNPRSLPVWCTVLSPPRGRDWAL